MNSPLHRLLLGVALSVLAFLLFIPALGHDFVNWDDDINLIGNRDFRGLGLSQLRWMFTTTLSGHYIPITWLTFGLDFALWGMNPLGYHLTNLVLHAVNVVLFFLVARHLLVLASPWQPAAGSVAAAAAALVFGLHPLRVESVAWVTERRDVLSGCLFLLTTLAYLHAVRSSGRRRRALLALSVGCYALALGAKSIVMTLPLVLLLLDVYPLRRLPPEGGVRRWREAIPVLREKLPYLVLALATAALALYAVHSGAHLTPIERLPWLDRLAVAAYAYAFYPLKTVLPVGLSPLYPLPTTLDPLEPRFVISAATVVTATGILWRCRRAWPAGLAAWVYYLIVLAPVSGLVHSGHQLAHDRYSYLSCLGFAILAGGGAGATLRLASDKVRPALVKAATLTWGIAVAGLGVLTWLQLQVWKDSETLWRHALDLDASCIVCRVNLGVALYDQRRFSEAQEQFIRVLEINPDNGKARYNIGLSLVSLGQPVAGEIELRAALPNLPKDAKPLKALGWALMNQGRHDEAIETLRHALSIAPGDALAHAYLAAALSQTGRLAEAVPHYRAAISQRPESPEPRLGLINTYLALGQDEDARAEYARLATIDPALARRVQVLFKSR